ncbi:ABC transporter substrate-binding protein [Streptomyces sp. NPDC051243]|uniref:ABC transporter substrate-binding protein n=1 Tax=Streptomyces sp. NPDC051243 TaxID=3365646 RepID=UPI0037B3F36D
MAREAWSGSAGIEAADAVFELMRRLIDNFRDNPPVTPLVVLQATEEDPTGTLDRRAAQVVEFVRQGHQPRGLIAKRLDGGGGVDAYSSAIDMVRQLCEHPWDNQSQSQYKPFTFPRSRLLRAIEQAAPEVGGEVSTVWSAAQRRERLMRRLAELRWRPGRDPDGADEESRVSAVADTVGAVVNPSGFVGAMFIACLSVLLGEGGWQTAVWGGALALAAFGVVHLLARSAPPLLWLRRASRWFATTTFLAPSSDRPEAAEWSRWRPTKSWETIRGRAFAAAQQVVAAEAGDMTARQFHLELRVLALLEDLRENFRPRTLDLRRRKRTVPPVVYLPCATEDDGGLLLLRAISNVRSRRSEVDPLLVLAAIPAAERLRPPGFEGPVLPVVPHSDGSAQDDGERAVGADARYQEWVTGLNVGQSPGRSAALPWILRIPLSADELRRRHSAQHSTTRIRRTAAWLLWSRPCLAVVLTIALALGFLGNRWMAERYCAGRLIGSNTDSVLVGGECVGIATGDVRLAAGNGLELYGAGKGITFDTVEQAIRAENARIGPKDKYVTIVYAGPVTAADEAATRKGLEEITGVYLYQHYANVSTHQPTKIRVLLANGGQNMLHVLPMARHIADLARRDRSIVGVVGMGRNTTESAGAVQILKGAGLPVVSTTNSSSRLARKLSNWFGLAATDEEEANAMLVLARQLARRADGARAVVLARKVGSEKDFYTTEQARVGRQMLDEAGFGLLPSRSYGLSPNGEPELTDPVESICASRPVPRALYFAGRVEDVPNLMSQLGSTPGCNGRDITVFTGDDLAKSNYAEGESLRIPAEVTLYHFALAPMDLVGDTGFYQDSHAVLGDLLPAGASPTALADPARPWDDALFSSGQTVLAYSATAVLYRASKNGDAPQTAPETWADLRWRPNPNLPVGTVSFAGSQPYADQRGHGYKIVRVTYRDHKVRSETVCGRPAGSDQPLSAPPGRKGADPDTVCSEE